MQLFYSSTSPFARKVLVCAAEHDLSERLELTLGHPIQNADTIAAVTPLGKVPALLTDTGHLIVDSPLICEHIDRIAVSEGQKSLIPSRTTSDEAADEDARVHALADGIMDAAYLYIMESNRPAEQQSPMWKQRWTQAVVRTLDFLNESVEQGLSPSTLTMGGIALGCALGYLDFRLPELRWREDNPALADFYAPMSSRPSFLTSDPAN